MYDDDLQQYVITCEVEGCGGPIPIWQSASQLTTSAMAREMLQKGVYARSVCPFECERTVVRHGLSTDQENNVIDGAGLTAAGFEYESASESAQGLSTFEARSDRVRATLVHSLWREADVSLSVCSDRIQKRRLVCPHGLWVYKSTTASAYRLGDCVCTLATRSQLQGDVMRAFFRHASSVTSLPHFEWTRDEIRVALTSPGDGIECDEDVSRVRRVPVLPNALPLSGVCFAGLRVLVRVRARRGIRARVFPVRWWGQRGHPTGPPRKPR